MAEQINDVLPSTPDQIKITIKLQNDQPGESAEVYHLGYPQIFFFFFLCFSFLLPLNLVCFSFSL